MRFSPNYLEFVARLRRARLARHLTQTELATLLGKPQSYVSKVETCERRIDVIETAEWCIHLQVRLDDLLPEALRRVLDGEAPSCGDRAFGDDPRGAVP